MTFCQGKQKFCVAEDIKFAIYSLYSLKRPFTYMLFCFQTVKWRICTQLLVEILIIKY